MFESTAVAPDLYAASFAAPRWAAHSFSDGSPGSSPSRRSAAPRPGRCRLARLAVAAISAATVVATASVILPSSVRSAEASRPSHQCMATSCDPSYTLKKSVGADQAVAIGAPVTVAVPAQVSTTPCVSAIYLDPERGQGAGMCTMAA